MLISDGLGRVESSYVPGLGEEVYNTISGNSYRGNGYTSVSSLTPESSGGSGGELIPLYAPLNTSAPAGPSAFGDSAGLGSEQGAEFRISNFPSFSIVNFQLYVYVEAAEDTDGEVTVDFSVNYMFRNMDERDPDDYNLFSGDFHIPVQYDEVVQSRFNGTLETPFEIESCDYLQLKFLRLAEDEFTTAYSDRIVYVAGLRLLPT